MLFYWTQKSKINFCLLMSDKIKREGQINWIILVGLILKLVDKFILNSPISYEVVMVRNSC